MATKVHWNYFIALEQDLETASRFVEFDDRNMDVFSIEFARLLFAAASEVDVIAKLICSKLNPTAKAENMPQYKSLLSAGIPELVDMEVRIPRYEITLKPWAALRDASSRIAWWDSYNAVKHDRGRSYSQATLKNALEATAGLMLLTYFYYGLEKSGSVAAISAHQTTESLAPPSTLLRLDEWRYPAIVTYSGNAF